MNSSRPVRVGGPRGIVMAGGRNKIAYLLRDDFITAASAPLASPRTCEPGPGTMTLVQNDGQFSIASGALQIPAQGTPTQTDLGLYTGTYTRKVGRMVTAKITRSNQAATYYPYLAWGLSGETLPATINNPELSVVFQNNSTFSVRDTATFALPGQTSYGYFLTNVRYELALILRSTGGFIAIRGGLWPVWTLVAVRDTGNGASLRPLIDTYTGPASTADYFYVADLLDAKYQSSNGLAVNYISAPANGETTIMQPDGIVKFTWKPAAAETLELDIRRTDDDNRWIVRCDQAGSTIKLIERNAGVEIERKSVAQTWTIGTNYTISVHCDALRYGLYVNDVWKDYYYDSTFNYTATGVKVSGFTTGSNLAIWPRTIDIPIPETGVTNRLMSVGDSKCSNDSSGICWQTYLLDSLPIGYVESLRWARGGATIVSLQALTASGIARMPVQPERIMVNIGVNDLPALPAQAVVESNLGSILDILHAKFPGALMYVAYPWAVGRDAASNTLAGYINNILAARSTWAFAGMDERVSIKGGDNGASETTDGIHYSNPVGNTAAAAGWKTAMGL